MPYKERLVDRAHADRSVRGEELIAIQNRLRPNVSSEPRNSTVLQSKDLRRCSLMPAEPITILSGDRRGDEILRPA
jgi:hypothetical protein